MGCYFNLKMAVIAGASPFDHKKRGGTGGRVSFPVQSEPGGEIRR